MIFALERARVKGLLETGSALFGSGLATRYRITSIGAYSIKVLAGLFAYVDAMVADTPIVDITVQPHIRDVRAIKDRVDRAERFVVYLDAQFEDFEGSERLFDWTSRSSQVRKEITGIRARLG
ncbi:MAG: hypothetical protein H0U53_10395 [Actinobacteria bacterium]|nr:hypothetical protein [Actinomycetota bacterium]